MKTKLSQYIDLARRYAVRLLQKPMPRTQAQDPVSGTRSSILSALRRRSHEKFVKFDRIIDEAVEIAREFDRSTGFESLLYRARKVTDIGGNVVAAVVALLQEIPLDQLESKLNEREGAEIYKLRGSILKVLKKYRDLRSFQFSIDEARRDPRYVEIKMKELMRGAKYFETLLIFFFDRLQAARKTTSSSDPILNEIRFLYAPLTERMQFIFLADDFRDQYLRISDPGKYRCVEKDVVMKKIGMNYDDAKIYLRGFTADLQGFLRSNYYELTHGISSIYWRVKSPFSIWNKVEVRRKYGYDKVRDILGIKIICKTERNIRDIADILIKRYKVPAKDIEDNIWSERESGWRAFTIVITDQEGRPIEIQLMTEEMDYHNTFSRAATWKYNLEKDMAQVGITQNFNIAVTGILNGDPEKNFYRMYHHWAA